MFRVNVFEIKARLSEYLDRAAEGERILICRHNKPVAELRAVEAVRTKPRSIGPLPGRPTFDVPGSFFDPLADDDLDLWDGGNNLISPISTSETDAGASKAAETTTRNRRRPARRVARRRS